MDFIINRLHTCFYNINYIIHLYSVLYHKL